MRNHRTLANHLQVSFFGRTFALPRPVQVKALANEQVSKFINKYRHALRIVKTANLIHNIYEHVVRTVDRQCRTKYCVGSRAATPKRRRIFNVIQPMTVSKHNAWG